MDFTQLANLGEFLGGLAVIASLVYVGIQIRHNTAVARGTSHQGFTDSINQINEWIVCDPAVTDVFLKGCEDRSALDPNECLRFDYLLHSTFHVYETLFYQREVGTVDEKLLAAEGRSLVSLFAFPGVHEWWANSPFAFPMEFRDYIDELAETSSAVDRES